MKNGLELFGSMVFNNRAMKELLPSKVYISLKNSINNNEPIDPEMAEAIAHAMKVWAIEKGATHFTHWFQPLTEITAEKHNSFLDISPEGNVETNFSVRELVKGESDASSFPSGGLRATFEARGYTSWDPTSFAFVKNHSLYIPSFFCSYSGEVLDEKTPLLKSMYALNKQSLRILKILGNDKVTKVTPCTGAEQEYFLIDKEFYTKRQDIITCGRTLFGAKPVKSQDISNHYFAALKPKIADFMQELDEELWKLGIPSKTKHNEVAPAQHEVAQIYTYSNIAADQNHLIMETLRVVAERHNLVCLLHEKPFDKINGSGKHNNWSLVSNRGINLLEPGKSPQDNIQFLIFLCAMIKAVDEYSDLLRISASSPSNDCRLGGHEAPPAIISVYLGEEIMAVLEALEAGEVYTCKRKGNFEIGLNVFSNFPCDTSDRNRTSPFAFTGNKFEFRMVGSSQSVAVPNMILNTIAAQALKEFADELENSSNLALSLNALLVRTIKKHKRVIFNGNSYSEKWELEAKKRGLYNLKTTVDALNHFLDEKNINLFETHGVLSKKEMISRYEVHMKNYCNVIHIEAQTMISIIKRDILPAVSRYTKELSETINLKSQLNGIAYEYELESLEKLSRLLSQLHIKVSELIVQDEKAHSMIDTKISANSYKDIVIKIMSEARSLVDEMELKMPKDYWPYPTYQDILFSI